MSRAALEALASSPDRLASVCSPRDAAELAQGVQGALRSVSNAADGEDVRDRLWRLLSKTVLAPRHPYQAHRLLHEACYADWDVAALGPVPLWSADRRSGGYRRTNLSEMMATLSDERIGKQAAFVNHQSRSPSSSSSSSSSPVLSLEWERRSTGDPIRDYDLFHKISVDEPEFFWPRMLQRLRVDFAVRPYAALEFDRRSNHPDDAVWLPGSRLNAAAAALSSASFDDDSPALVAADETEPTTTRTVRRRELRHASNTIAAGFLSCGLAPGDRVAVVGSLNPALVAVYLGAVLAGLVPVAVAESFSSTEIATRLRLSGAAAVWCADGVRRGGKMLPLVPRVLEAARKVVADEKSSNPPSSLLRLVLVGSSGSAGVCGSLLGDGDTIELDSSASGAMRNFETSGSSPTTTTTTAALRLRRWGDVLGSLPPGAAFSFLPHTPPPPSSSPTKSPVTLLFSSGTTGEPKAIPWSHATPLRCAVDCHANLDVRVGDVLCWPTSLGWMMGAFSIFGSLLNGAALALFDGAPLGKAFGEFVSAARVTQLGVVPSMVRAWRAAGWLDAERGEGEGQGEGRGRSGILSPPPSMLKKSPSPSSSSSSSSPSSSSKIPDWGSLRLMASTGEASAPEDYAWLSSRARYVPVLEFCGGTEVGSAYAAGTLLQGRWAPSTFATPTLGCSFVLLVPEKGNGKSDDADADAGDEASRSLRQSGHGSTEPCSGELALVPPILGSSTALFVLGDEAEGKKRHRKTYYDGMPSFSSSNSPPLLLRRHGDAFARLPAGPTGSGSGSGSSSCCCYAALGRTDDAMNLGGVKVASAEVERVVLAALGGGSGSGSGSGGGSGGSDNTSSSSSSSLPLVSEVAAVGVPAPGGGPDSLVLVVVPRGGGGGGGGGGTGGGGDDDKNALSSSSSSSSSLESSLRSAAAAAIRRDLSPLFRVDRVVLRPSLPRTATGKVMRRTLRDELRAGAKL